MRSPIRAEPDDRTAVDAFRGNVRNCLRHYRLAEALLLAGRDAGALHHGRVAPRRLRSWLTLFGPIVTDLRYAALREELHWLTSEPGVARNLDVLLARRADNDLHDRISAAREAACDRPAPVFAAEAVRR